MGEANAGIVRVLVLPDTSRFAAELRRELEPIMQKAGGNGNGNGNGNGVPVVPTVPGVRNVPQLMGPPPEPINSPAMPRSRQRGFGITPDATQLAKEAYDRSFAQNVKFSLMDMGLRAKLDVITEQANMSEAETPHYYRLSAMEQDTARQLQAQRLRRGERVERTWDQYELAKQKQEEKVAERVEKSWESAGLSQQKQKEKQAERVDKSWDSANLAAQRAEENAAEKQRIQAKKDAARTEQERARLAREQFQTELSGMGANAQARAIRERMATPGIDPFERTALQRQYNQLTMGRGGRSGYTGMNTQIAPMGLFFQTMFGAWDVAQTYQNVSNANRMSRLAGDPIEALRMRSQAINSAGGIFGSILTSAWNGLGEFAGIDSPGRLQQDVEALGVRDKSTRNTIGMIEERASSTRLRAAQQRGGYALAMQKAAEDERDTVAKIRDENEKRKGQIAELRDPEQYKHGWGRRASGLLLPFGDKIYDRLRGNKERDDNNIIASELERETKQAERGRVEARTKRISAQRDAHHAMVLQQQDDREEAALLGMEGGRVGDISLRIRRIQGEHDKVRQSAEYRNQPMFRAGTNARFAAETLKEKASIEHAFGGEYLRQQAYVESANLQLNYQGYASRRRAAQGEYDQAMHDAPHSIGRVFVDFAASSKRSVQLATIEEEKRQRDQQLVGQGKVLDLALAGRGNQAAGQQMVNAAISSMYGAGDNQQRRQIVENTKKQIALSEKEHLMAGRAIDMGGRFGFNFVSPDTRGALDQKALGKQLDDAQKFIDGAAERFAKAISFDAVVAELKKVYNALSAL